MRISPTLTSLLSRMGHLLHPPHQEPLTELEPPGYTSAAPGNSILVLEEDRSFSLLIKQFLSRKNFNVQLAHNIADGLAIAAAMKPDTIWVSSTFIAQDQHLLQKLRNAAPKARICEKAKTIKFQQPDRTGNGAEIE